MVKLREIMASEPDLDNDRCQGEMVKTIADSSEIRILPDNSLTKKKSIGIEIAPNIAGINLMENSFSPNIKIAGTTAYMYPVGRKSPKVL